MFPSKWAFAIVVAVIIAVALPMAAQSPKLYSSDSVVYGKTYSEWSGAWWQWALSIPSATHPLFDNGDCSVGQSGPVWFLGGKFCALNSPDCGYTNVVRSCSVPAGKALCVAVLNGEWSVLEMNDPKAQIADLRSMSAAAIDGATNIWMNVDGSIISHLKRDFRVQSPAFPFTIPDDNLFTAIGEGPYVGGSYFPAVDDGVYVMLDALPVGPHKIHFHGYMPMYNFTLDIKYNLTVVK